MRKLREADRMLGKGADLDTDLDTVCRHLEVSQPTYHRWRAHYGGMEGRRCEEAERTASWASEHRS